ncbi:pyrroline-5-carboxylate reductase [Neorhodopirellula pilleata]|nr:pyrroline-5-carboxylate reductase [Neorhodopirellula pilleata]
MTISKLTVAKLTSVGGGQMARALIGGMIAKEALSPNQIAVIEPTASSRDWWSQTYSGCQTSGTEASGIVAAMDNADLVLLAVKPHVMSHVFENEAYNFGDKLVISIAAGLQLGTLVAGVGHDRVVRVMPNTPSLVGEGAAGFCCADGVTPSDVDNVEKMLASVGYVTQVSESQMDAVTAVSGSGPAYMFLLIEALADGGVAEGLPRQTALELATQTMLGAAKMVRDTGLHPGQLKDNVCSPGGTTIAAVRSLEQNGARAAMIDAVAAAARRSRELK